MGTVVPLPQAPGPHNAPQSPSFWAVSTPLPPAPPGRPDPSPRATGVWACPRPRSPDTAGLGAGSWKPGPCPPGAPPIPVSLPWLPPLFPEEPRHLGQGPSGSGSPLTGVQGRDWAPPVTLLGPTQTNQTAWLPSGSWGHTSPLKGSPWVRGGRWTHLICQPGGREAGRGKRLTGASHSVSVGAGSTLSHSQSPRYKAPGERPLPPGGPEEATRGHLLQGPGHKNPVSSQPALLGSV